MFFMFCAPGVLFTKKLPLATTKIITSIRNNENHLKQNLNLCFDIRKSSTFGSHKMGNA